MRLSISDKPTTSDEVLAVVCMQNNDPSRGRRAIAATGWDLHPPKHVLGFEQWIVAQALEQLRAVLDVTDDNAAREGRALGLYDTARACMKF
jgi:hypothetical protein